MFRNILFPVDFSDNSGRILPFAIQLAKKFEAKLHVVFVARDLSHLGGIYVPHPSIDSFSSEIRRGAEKMMKEFYDENFDDMQGVERHILIGDPATEIVTFAEDKNVNLIIMGTHGRKGLDRVIFGSVAENVTRNSPVPVMTINPHRLEQQ